MAIGQNPQEGDGAWRARTHDGKELSYKRLIVACRTDCLRRSPAGAQTFGGITGPGPDSRAARRELLSRPVEKWTTRAEQRAAVWVAVARRGRALSKAGVKGASPTILTPENAPLHLFGPGASERVGELLSARGIQLITAARPVKCDDSRLALSPIASVEVDPVLACSGPVPGRANCSAIPPAGRANPRR
jgi:hypothetical protein